VECSLYSVCVCVCVCVCVSAGVSVRAGHVNLFRRVPQIAESDCWLRHFHPAWNNSAPTGRISMNFDI